MLQPGLELLIIGMGVVLSFLLLLVAIMYLVGALIQRLLPPDAEPTPSPARPTPPRASPAEVIAVAAAYHARRHP